MFQNETDPKSVALSIWKWLPEEDQGVLEYITKL